MTYDEAVSWLQTMLEIPQNNEDIDFTRIIPAMFLYAEGRIYRELDFLASLSTQPLTLTPNNRELALPAGVLAVRHITVFTPPGAVTNSSIRTPPLERITPDTLDFFWPQGSYKSGVPKKFAIVGSTVPSITTPHTLRFMPTPDRAYTIEVYGDIMPLTLSKDNPQTYLSITYPSLYLTACMVFGTGYQRDYGGQADDPQHAMSWENQYTTLRQGVMLEAAQMRGEGPGWTAVTPAPAAQPRAP